MTIQSYNKKKALIKKSADSFTKKATNYYSKLMLRDCKGTEDSDLDLLKLHADDLSKTLVVCYATKGENFIEAYNMWYDMDTDPQSQFPVRFVDLLNELSEYQDALED